MEAFFDQMNMIKTVFGQQVALGNIMTNKANFVPLEVVEKTNEPTTENESTTQPEKKGVGFQIPKKTVTTTPQSKVVGDNDKQVVNDISLTSDKKTAVCPVCSGSFYQKNYRHKYCSNECRYKAYEQRTGNKSNYKKIKS